MTRTGCCRFNARSFALFRFLSTIHLHIRVSADVWATVLALVYLQKYLTKQGDLLNALEEKAMGYLRQVGGIPLATLLERANSLLA